ncbi:MAG: NAD(P)/FAD-dependent oxidoreductase, partial [Halobacteriales archaeon]|nr:NAD(P)/FAD-dependent oxidoreductase [Halobacteriales archaeon]
MSADIVVVGGGLAGLVAARHLARAGYDVTVYEREQEVGGRVRSARREGYVLDRGFQVLLTGYPAARRELDLDALDLRTFRPGACLARPGERSILADPLREPTAAVETLFNRDVTIGDKLRTLRLRRELGRLSMTALERFDDRDIETFLRERGFSRQFLDRFIAPFYGGITLDRSLSTSAFVFAATWKVLSTGQTVVPAGGMGAIPRQLADRATADGATVETNRSVDAIEGGADGVSLTVDGDWVQADAVVVATDPAAARELTGVETIPTTARGCVTQYYALETGTPLPTGRRIVLNTQSEGPNQVVPVSAVAPEHAPEGTVLLSATFLGQPEADPAELSDQTQTALESWFPEQSFARLRLIHTASVPFAQVEQPPGFLDDRPQPTAPDGAVYLAGDYTQWSSIQGALESGRR